MEEGLSLVICLMVMLVVFAPIVNNIEQEGNIENYNIEECILIDNFISFDKAGNSHYYLIYKFIDGSIKEFEVNEEKYYTSIDLQLLKEGE